MFGVTFSPRELYTSLNEASSRKIGARIQDLILLCFHYRPITGRYGNIIMITVRTLGVATLLGLPALIITMARNQSRSSRRQEAQIKSDAQDQSLLRSAAPIHKTETTGGSP
jgi:protein SCO1/2